MELALRGKEKRSMSAGDEITQVNDTPRIQQNNSYKKEKK